MNEKFFENYIEQLHNKDDEKRLILQYKMIQEISNIKNINEFENIEEMIMYIKTLNMAELKKEFKMQFQNITQKQKNRLLDEAFNSQDINTVEALLDDMPEIFTPEEITEILNTKKEIIKKAHPQIILDLMIASGTVEQYLTLEKIKEYQLPNWAIVKQIIELGKAEEYLTTENCEKYKFDSKDIVNLISATNNIEYYLKEEQIKKYNLEIREIREIIKNTKKIELLTPEFIKKVGFKERDVISILSACADLLNKENLNLIYELNMNHSHLHNTPEAIYNNLDYILEKEGHLDKREIIEKIYPKNNFIVCVDYEFLNQKNVDILGEENLGKICNDLYVIAELLQRDDEQHLKLIKQCYDAGIDKVLNRFDTQMWLTSNMTLQELIPLVETLNKNKFKLPEYYAKQLASTQNVKAFCENSDFRFFKSELPDIEEDLNYEFPEEGADFFKFATALGCFSTEKMLDKKGKETQVLLAQKSSSLLAQLLKIEGMKLRKLSWII